MAERRDIRVLFVGGTGRSGTKIVSKVLGRHSQILHLPGEPSFIVHPDGLLDLGYYLTDGWSFLSAAKVIERFAELMKDISNPLKSNPIIRILNRRIAPLMNMSPMRYHHLYWHENLGERHIVDATARFIKRISEGAYNGFWWGTPSFKVRPQIFSSRKLDYSYYRDCVHDFLQDLLSRVYKGEAYWIDDTPHTIIYAEELLKLFPSGKVLHVHRDIRDVIASHKKMRWACHDIKLFCPWLKSTIEKWMDVKKEIPGESYHEVKMEELLKNSNETVRGICNFVEIPFEAAMLDVDMSRGHVDRWKHDLSDDEVQFVKEEFKTIMEHYNYA